MLKSFSNVCCTDLYSHIHTLVSANHIPVMPASKAKSANGSASAKPAKGSPASTVPPSPAKPSETGTIARGSGKPNKNAFDAEQEGLKSEIDALQTKLVCYSFLHHHSH